MRTVRSSALPVIVMVIARSASTTSRKKPPFLAWITTPCSLGDDVWTAKPSLFRYSSMWDCTAAGSLPLPWKCSALSPITFFLPLAVVVSSALEGADQSDARSLAHQICGAAWAARGNLARQLTELPVDLSRPEMACGVRI